MNLRTRARKLFGRDKLAEHSVCATKVDHAVLNDLRRRAPKIEERITTPPRIGDDDALDGKVWERLSEDMWSALYGDDEPELRSREKIDQRFRVNREVADKSIRDEDFRETRAMTRGHLEESALGLLGALDSLAQSYGNELAEHAQRANEIADAEDNLDSLDEYMEHLRELRREGDPGGLSTEQIDERIREAAARKRGAVDQLQAAQAAQQAHAGSLIDAAKRAVAKAVDAAQDGAEIVSLLPGKGAGTSSRLSPDLMLDFANRVHGSDTLRRVLEMMGKLDLAMGNARRQMRRGGFEEMVDIELGDDLRSILPQEKVLLMHPMGKLDFVRRFHERSLMQYEMWSEQELKRGPVIVAADGSGSMSGMPNIFCRGLTLASCGIAHREHRNSAAIEFGSTGELREFRFPHERAFDTATAIDFAEHFFAGGTDINQVLLRAYDMIREEAPFHTADLIIVTDGQDHYTESTEVMRDKLRAMGVRIHGLMIAAAPSEYLVKTCDTVTAVWDFAGPNNASDRIAIDLT